MTQLALFPDDDTPDSRPLPLIVAAKWDFPLQHYETDGGYLFAVQDWIAGLTGDDTKKAAKAWMNMQSESVFSKDSLPYLASDGKTYQRDFVDDKMLYLVAQSLRSSVKRTVLKEVKSYLAASGVLIDEMRLDPSKAIEAGVGKYQRQGKSEAWIETRTMGIYNRKLFTAAMDAAIIDLTKQTYGKATETLYKGMWQRTTAQLRNELNLSQGQNIRDAMSSIALHYVGIAELVAAEKLGEAQEVSEVIAMDIIYTVAKIISGQAQKTAEFLGVDPFTGQKLLKAVSS